MARTSIDDNYVLPDSNGVQDPSPTAADTTNGNTYTNDGTIVLAVVNGSASPVNLTVGFPSHKDVDGVALPDKTVEIPASATMKFRFTVRDYGTDVAIDGTTDLSFFLIR